MLRIGNVTVDSGDGAVSNQVERIIGANYSFQSAFRRAEEAFRWRLELLALIQHIPIDTEDNF